MCVCVCVCSNGFRLSLKQSVTCATVVMLLARKRLTLPTNTCTVARMLASDVVHVICPRRTLSDTHERMNQLNHLFVSRVLRASVPSKL